MGKKIWIGVVVIALIVAGFVMFGGNKGNDYISLASAGEVDYYKSGSCGCCGIHASYLDREGGLDVNVMNFEDLSGIKQKYGIPPQLESCHTAVIDGYVVEGHMPLEVIDKLLMEKPDIKGIALPGMPLGSPGMPGAKKGEWIIYQLNHDGTYEEWMRY